MPNLTSHAAAFRGRHAFSGYLSTLEEPIVFSRAVNMPAVLYPLTRILYDDPYAGVGAYTDVQEGMEILVYAGNSSTIKGRLRVAAGGATTTSLQVNEFSENRLKLADNDRFEVVRSFRLRDKLIGASATFPKDSRVEYSDQNSLVAPLAHSGGHWAGWLENGSVDVPFVGSSSAVLDPDSGGTLAHNWNAPGALTPTSIDVDPTFTFTQAGTYWVEHVVTDSANSRTAKQRCAVRVHDDNDLPIPVTVEMPLAGSVNDGWSCTFRTYANSSIAALPDGAMVIYHEDEWFENSKANYGNRVASRSRVKLVGYLVGNSIRADAETGELLFEVASPLAVLRQLPGFSQALKAVATPSNWQQWKTPLRTNDLLVYLLRWHTTYSELFDVVLPAYNYAYPEFFVQQKTPAAQLEEIADAVDASLRCDRTGALIVRQDVNRVGASARNAAVVTYALEDADIIDLQIEYEHRYKVAQLIGRGFTTMGAPLQSASGDAPTEAGEFTSVERKIVDAQRGNDRCLDERTGWLYAQQNGLKDGLPVPRAVVTLRGSYDFFDPAYDEWVTLTLDREVHGRQVSFENARFAQESVEIAYEVEEDDHGIPIRYKRVRLTLVGETDGAAGVKHTSPQSPFGGIDFGSFELEAPPVRLTLDPLMLPSNAIPVEMILQGTAPGNFARSTLLDVLTGTANFENIGAGITGNQFHGCPDYFDFRRRFVITENGVFVCDNIWGPAPSFSLYASANEIFGTPTISRGRIAKSINRKKYIAVSSGDLFACSFDDGSSWNVTNFVGYATGNGTHGVSSFVLSQRNSASETDGVLYLAYRIQGAAWGVPTQWRIFKSTDWGRTWNLRPNLNYSANFGNYEAYMHLPYTRTGGSPNANDDRQVVWWHFSEGDAGPATTSWISENGGSSVAYSRQYNAFLMRPRIPVCAVASYTPDSAYSYMVAGDNTYARVASTTDGWVSLFTGNQSTDAPLNILPFPTTGNPPYSGVNGWGTSPDILLWWGGTTVRFTTNRGAHWYNITAPFETLIAEFDLSRYIGPS